jgi:hypothetical protein
VRSLLPCADLAGAVLIAGGCGDRSAGIVPPDGPRTDAPVDAGPDIVGDFWPDADVVPGDLGADLVRDAGVDGTADSGSLDLGSDLVSDAASDPAFDSAADVGVADGASDGGCAPLADDPNAIGDNCESPPGQPDPTACPAGYECIPFAGFVGTFTCEIRCAQTCECPPPSTCGQRCDKVGCIDACVP